MTRKAQRQRTQRRAQALQARQAAEPDTRWRRAVQAARKVVQELLDGTQTPSR